MQGGDPSPFDRIQATRFASRCVDYLIEEREKNSNRCTYIGLNAGKMQFHPMEDFMRVIDTQYQRPKEQWWLELRSIAKLLAQPGPTIDA